MRIDRSTLTRARLTHLPGLTSRVLAALLASLACAGPASAALFEDNEARRAILDLRNRVEALRGSLDALRGRTEGSQRELTTRLDQIGQSESTGRDKLEARVEASTSTTARGQIELAGQIDVLRQDLARLRGQIETLVNDLSNSQKRQKDFYVDLDTRMRKLEPQQATVDGKAAMVDQSENRAFDAAMSQFRASEFRNAVTAFDGFLRQYPASAFAPAAQYWMGTSLYAQRDYKGAIAAQQVLLKNWPDSPRVPEALLNIASSQIDLKDAKGARTTLQSIVSKYPDTPTAGVARDRLATLK